MVTFVLDLYTGRISDRKITYKVLEGGDSFMADSGYELAEDLPDGVSLNIPLFLDEKPQLDVENEIETRRVASGRELLKG